MLSILYVDDEIGLLEIGKIFLEQTGECIVDTCLSGQEALALLARKEYDAVVSDYQMPEINGIELLRKVRSSYTNMPFVLFTGRGREEVVIEALNFGADFYLQKGGDPVSQFTELRHHLKQAIARHQAEIKLRKSEERFRLLIEKAPVAVGIGREGRTLYANQRYVRMFGYKDKSEFLSLPFLALIAPQDRERVVKSEMYRSLLTEEVDRDLMGVRKDGSSFPFHVTVAFINLEDGDAYICIFTDVTEHVIREERLRSSMTHLQLAMDMAHMAFWSYDVKTRTMEVNDQFYALHGTDAEREGGYHKSTQAYYDEFVHPDDLPRLEEIERKDYDSGHPHAYLQYKYRIKRRDGAIRDLLVRLSFVKKDEGKLIRIEGISQDITDLDKVFNGR